jgi:RNA polymerase sigma factor (sigma-70 family)
MRRMLAGPADHVAPSRMPGQSLELQRLLEARTDADRERAWTCFVEAYSKLILHVTRSVARDHDEGMDAFAYVLEALRAKGFARVRAFADDGRSKFTTWLVVVVRRLCLDERRRRYGRPRVLDPSAQSHLERAFRRRLRDLTASDVQLMDLASGDVGIDEDVIAAEVREALAAGIDALPPADRLLIALRFDDGLSAQDIARLLQMPTPFHVYRRLEAVTRTLRAFLVARGVTTAT